MQGRRRVRRPRRDPQPGGLDITAVLHAPEGERLGRRLPGDAIRSSNEDLLLLDVDWLIPAALGGVIHARNAEKSSAKAVVEAANHPVTPEADAILNERGRRRRAGHHGELRRRDRVLLRVDAEHPAVPLGRGTGEHRAQRIMTKMFADVAGFKETHEKATWREAAFASACERVAQAVRLRGYV